jgi:hypothetical protein
MNNMSRGEMSLSPVRNTEHSPVDMKRGGLTDRPHTPNAIESREFDY